MSMPKKIPFPGNLKLPGGHDLESQVVERIQKATKEFSSAKSSGLGRGNNEDTDIQAQDDKEFVGVNDYDDLKANEEYIDEDQDERTDGRLTRNAVQSRSEFSDKVQQPRASTFFKSTGAGKDRERRGMMSPVMGTEALYKQAGWLTPEEEAAVRAAGDGSAANITISGEDNDDEYDDDDAIVVDEMYTSTGSEGEHLEGSPRRGPRIMDLGGSNNSVTDLKPTPSTATRKGASRSIRTTADGFATSRVAREASRSPSYHGKGSCQSSLEDEVNVARQSSAQIRGELLESHNINVLGLLTTVTGNGGDENEQDDDDEIGSSQFGGSKADLDKASQQPDTSKGEEDFQIPRSMREIYKISNRNRKFKKAGSPTPPERGPTVTNEKELAELQKAEALLRERGMDAAGFLFATTKPATTNYAKADGDTTSGGSSSSNHKTRSRKHQDAGDIDGAKAGTAATDNRLSSKQDDISFFRKIGWIPPEESDTNIMSECYGQAAGGGETDTAGAANAFDGQGHPTQAVDSSSNMAAGSTYAAPFNYQQAMPIVGHHSLQAAANGNPFFAGAALQGGPLTQNFRTETAKSSRKSSNSGSSSNNNNNPRNNNNSSGGNKARGRPSERPEKRDGGRSHAYRSNR